jgi:hypothetical protein
MTSIPNWDTIFIQGLILALAIVSLLLSMWASRAGSPIIAIFGRWSRWIFISFLISGTIYVFGWTGYPFKVLLPVAVLAWFLVETAYNWIAISALSKSDLPLFPVFEENDRGDEWPSDTKFINLKNWLRREGFSRRQSLISFLEDQPLMRVSVYENESQTHRLQVLLLPNMRGRTSVCLTFFSQTIDGEYIVTDNIFLPFGGFYPENWELERRPWMRSISKLWPRHLARVDARAKALVPFVLTPLEQINEDQGTVEVLNRELGFLYPVVEEAEKGRLTPGGRARVWHELWTLSYLGKALNY